CRAAPPALLERSAARHLRDTDVSRRRGETGVRRGDDRPRAPRASRSGDRGTVPRDHPARRVRRGAGGVIRPAELIQRKRDGQELGGEELGGLVLAYARGEVPDYQVA